MSALDNLLKEIPQDYDEVDVANHLLCFRENATAELATLRAQLEEANGIIGRLCFSIAYNKKSSTALLEVQKQAYQYLDSVKSGD